MLKKTSQKGFTIVELLIVIVVIGILAALVLNTFAGVQQRARNTERQTDVKAVASQLEAYYANEGYYPVYSALSAEDIDETLQGIDAGAVQPPGQDYGLINSATSSQNQYGYVESDCAAATGDSLARSCQSFTLTYFTEGDGEDDGVQTVNSLN